MNHILLFTCHRVSGEAAGSKHIKDVALFQLLMQPPFSLLFLFVSRFMYLFHGVHWLTTEGSVPRNDNNVVWRYMCEPEVFDLTTPTKAGKRDRHQAAQHRKHFLLTFSFALFPLFPLLVQLPCEPSPSPTSAPHVHAIHAAEYRQQLIYSLEYWTMTTEPRPSHTLSPSV